MGHTNDSSIRTVRDWLLGSVNFEIPVEAIDSILFTRGVDGAVSYSDAKNGSVDPRLLKADLLRWIVLGASKVNSTSDSDNGWSHSGGGYTLSEYDKKLLMAEANALYGELEPESIFGKTRIRMRSMGIMPAYRDSDGTPQPREVRS